MRSVLLLLLATLVAGCKSSDKTPEPAKVPLSEAPAMAGAMPGAAQSGTGAAGASASTGALAGPVIQKLEAPPYSYLLVKTAQGDVWAAVPQTKLDKGATVRVYNPMLMTKFESKTLKRTFDEVYFGTLTPDGSDAQVTGAGSAAGAMPGAMPPGTMPPGAMPPGATGANPHAGVPTPSAEPVKVGKVEKATGADAHTIAEAWAKKDALAGKTVTIRGTVVKYNAQVMGKNWLHLQDGSGDAAKGNNDITVTTMDQVVKGQTITIRGTVKTSQDFGAGYKYAIMVENAKVVKP
jgi:hypothetical protein